MIGRAMVSGAILAVAMATPVLAQNEDMRQAFTLAPEIRTELLADMRHHMDSLDDVLAALASGDFKRAASVAETQMGFGGGRGLGRFMPEDFRQMGQSMHRSALEFAATARQATASPTAENWQKTVAALQVVSTHCRSCHATFRVE